MNNPRPLRPSSSHWIIQGFIPAEPLPTLLAAKAIEHGDVALVFVSETQTVSTKVADIWQEAGLIAQALLDSGLRQGQSVAVQLPPTFEHMAVVLACLRAGLVYVPILNVYGLHETRYILEMAKVAALFVPFHFRKVDYAERMVSMGHLPDLKRTVFIGQDGLSDALSGAVTWQAFKATASVNAFRTAAQHDDIATILFTSGTTAEPKGVIHTNASIAAYCQVAAHYSPPDREKPNLVGIPGIGGMAYMLRPLLNGEGAVFVDHWSGPLAAKSIRDYKVWWTGGSPFHLQSILESSTPQHHASLRHAIVGGANVPPALIERADQSGISACRSYGSSEHPMATSALDGDTLSLRAYTDGGVMPGTVVHIIDDDGNALPDGQAGEIALEGPQQFAGYLDQALNAEAFTPEGWFKSGDIGLIESGRLRVVDRKKDIIIRGSQNISSKEVEDALSRHPDILEAAAIGWPDDKLGERVGAFLILREGCKIGLVELQAHFQSLGIARHKTPEHAVVVSELPRNTSGKVLKNELRRQAIKLEIGNG